MSSKFFGNRTDKHQPKKKGLKQNFSNKNNQTFSFRKHECIINIIIDH